MYMYEKNGAEEKVECDYVISAGNGRALTRDDGRSVVSRRYSAPTISCLAHAIS